MLQTTVEKLNEHIGIWSFAYRNTVRREEIHETSERIKKKQGFRERFLEKGFFFQSNQGHYFKLGSASESVPSKPFYFKITGRMNKKLWILIS
jgi:hypothetical protein